MLNLKGFSVIASVLILVPPTMASGPASNLDQLVGTYTLVGAVVGKCNEDIEVERNICRLDNEFIERGLLISGLPRGTGRYVFSGCEFNQGPIEREYTKNTGGAAGPGWEVPYRLEKEGSFDGTNISYKEHEYKRGAISIWSWFPGLVLERQLDLVGTFDGANLSFKVNTEYDETACVYKRKN